MIIFVLIPAVILLIYVFGLGGYFQPAKVVAVTVIRQGDNIIIAYQGESGSGLVSKLKYGIDVTDHHWNSPKVGERVTSPGAFLERTTLLVPAVFTDGSGYIILDTDV